MGSQCSCERDPSTSSGYLSCSSSPFPSLTEKSQAHNTDLQEQYDNPSRDRLNQNFLQTAVTASNNKLQLPLKRKKTDISNQNVANNPNFAVRAQKEECSQLSIGKNLDHITSEQEIVNQKITILQAKMTKNRKASIDYKIPLIIPDFQKNGDSSTQQILRSISGYILSQKNLFQPIKIPKENFIRFKNEDILKGYKFLQKLGEGSYGKVYKVQSKLTGEIRAAKIMKRSNITQQVHLKLMNEIDILRKLDHPNIIKIYEAYIYENVYCIITEYCSGGSLLNYIQNGKQFTDESLRIILRKLFSALSYIHQLNIVHRDIKLDNIVLVNKIETSGDLNSLDIRIIDFGLAKVLPSKRIKDRQKTGTYTHMAPEVINGIYSTKCDVWSAGVVLYSMIAGTSPFKKATKERTFQNILKGELEFPGSIWRETNVYLKDLIVKLLNKNLNERISSAAVMNHYFLRSPREGEPQKKIFEKVTKKLIEYHRGNNLIAMIESYVSYMTITQKQLQEFSAMFHVLDSNGDGVLQRKQLENAFQKSGHSFSKQQLDFVFANLSKDHEGKINYSEFVTILSDRSKLHARESMIEAFKYIDTNNNGFLQKEEIRFALQSIGYKQLSSILAQLDANNDSKVSQEEFIEYLQNQRLV